MLAAPSATAVAVGMAISSTSRDRTRQFLSIRLRETRAVVRGRASASRGPAAGSSRSVTEPSDGRPEAASAEPGAAPRDILLRDGTVDVPLTWLAGDDPRSGAPEPAFGRPPGRRTCGGHVTHLAIGDSIPELADMQR